MGKETIYQTRKSELSEIQNMLGRLEEGMNGLKSDITDLKNNDVLADKRLEDAYQKAMAFASTRQDKIREDLQHQIDNNKETITAINKGLKELNDNIKESNEEMKQFVTLSIEAVSKRVSILETQKEKKLLRIWNSVADKLTMILALGALAAFLKWLGFVQVAEKVIK